jgi:hypothetical protein
MTSRALSRAILLVGLWFTADAQSQPVVRVLDYGAEPRQAIRYEFTAGAVDHGTMTLSMQPSTSGQSAPALAMPTMKVPVTIKTTEVHPDGSARYEMEMGAIEIADDNGDAGGAGAALRQVLVAGLGSMAGAKQWARVDARGTTLDGGLDLPSSGGNGALAQALSMVTGSLQGQMQQLSAPFPFEPVGVGARWEVTTSTQLPGVNAEQNAEYTLVARDGNTVEIEMTLGHGSIQSAAAATDLPARAQAEIDDQPERTGGGRLRIDLGSILPNGEIEVSAPSRLQVVQGGCCVRLPGSEMTMTIERD